MKDSTEIPNSRKSNVSSVLGSQLPPLPARSAHTAIFASGTPVPPATPTAVPGPIKNLLTSAFFKLTNNDAKQKSLPFDDEDEDENSNAAPSLKAMAVNPATKASSTSSSSDGSGTDNATRVTKAETSGPSKTASASNVQLAGGAKAIATLSSNSAKSTLDSESLSVLPAPAPPSQSSPAGAPHLEHRSSTMTTLQDAPGATSTAAAAPLEVVFTLSSARPSKKTLSMVVLPSIDIAPQKADADIETKAPFVFGTGAAHSFSEAAFKPDKNKPAEPDTTALPAAAPDPTPAQRKLPRFKKLPRVLPTEAETPSTAANLQAGQKRRASGGVEVPLKRSKGDEMTEEDRLRRQVRERDLEIVRLNTEMIEFRRAVAMVILRTMLEQATECLLVRCNAFLRSRSRTENFLLVLGKNHLNHPLIIAFREFIEKEAGVPLAVMKTDEKYADLSEWIHQGLGFMNNFVSDLFVFPFFTGMDERFYSSLDKAVRFFKIRLGITRFHSVLILEPASQEKQGLETDDDRQA